MSILKILIRRHCRGSDRGTQNPEEVNLMRAQTESGRCDIPAAAEPPDLPPQVETLLHTVWECEQDWRLNDRIDLALGRERASARAAQRSHGSL